MKIKLFKGELRNVYRDCVMKGYTPATINEIGKLIKQNKIPRQLYFVREVFEYKFPKQRNITKKECLDVLKYSEENKWRGCFLIIWDNDSDFVLSNRDVNYNYALRGVVVGVRK